MPQSIRLPRWAACLALGLVSAVQPHPAAAQQPGGRGGSVLMLLEVQGELQVGGEIQGALSSADYISPRGTYLDAWALEGRVGATVTVDLMSDDFDAYLYALGPGFGETLRNDDGGGGCDARLTMTFLENGTFRVVASTAGSSHTGVYTLRVSDGLPPAPSYRCGGINPAVLADLPTEGRTLTIGDTMPGMLSSADRQIAGRHVQAWALRVDRDTEVEIILRAEDFDAYLYAMGPGFDEPLENDDGAVGTNSRLSATLSPGRTYVVVASALREGDTGAYTLSVTIPVDLSDLPTEGRMLALGDTVSGFLADTDPIFDGRHVQVWGLDVAPGTRVRITMRSEEFDTYLYLGGPGLAEPRHNDDGADGTNSRLNSTLSRGGTYFVAAGGYRERHTGPYTLTVTER